MRLDPSSEKTKTSEQKAPKLESILETLSLICCLGPFALIAKYWPNLPHQIPLHFDARGLPDNWGSKHSLFVGPIVALLMYVVLSVLAYAPKALEYMNLPRGVERQAPQTIRLIRELLVLCKILSGILIFEIVGSQIRVALGQAEGLKMTTTLALISGLVLLPPIYMIRFRGLVNRS